MYIAVLWLTLHLYVLGRLYNNRLHQKALYSSALDRSVEDRKLFTAWKYPADSTKRNKIF